MELGAHEPGVVRQLHDLHQPLVGGEARQHQTGLLHLGTVVVVELEAVTVPLGDLRHAIEGAAAAALLEHAGVLAKAHGAALFRHVHLVGHEGDDRMGRGLGELGGVRVLPAQHVPGKLHHRHLHAQADAKVRHAVLPGVPAGQDHALHAPVAEAAGHQHTGHISQHRVQILRRQRLGVHPADIHHRVVGGAGVVQRLHYGQICVVELGVLAHQGNGHLPAGTLLPLDHGTPLPQVRLVGDEAQLAAHHLVQALLCQQQRHLIEGLGRGVLDDARRLHIAEEGDLAADVLRQRRVAPAHQHVRLDPQGQKLLHRVLGGLALELSGAGDLHHQGHMDEGHVPVGPLCRHLADGLQEGLGLDVAHGAADLADDHVHVLSGHGIDALFNLIGDVGDDLHRGAQVVAPPLPVQHRPVDLAGGHGAVAGQVLVHEPLVVPQVQIRLRAVVGDEHLAVLVGAHGARVHIDIGVQLLVSHPHAPLLQKSAQRRRADPLSQAGHHAARDKHILRCHIHPCLSSLSCPLRGNCTLRTDKNGRSFQNKKHRRIRLRLKVPSVIRTLSCDPRCRLRVRLSPCGPCRKPLPKRFQNTFQG